MLHDVTISRTELITFRVDATSPDEAVNLMYDGDEIGSKTTDTTVESVTLVDYVPYVAAHEITLEPDSKYPHLARPACSCGWRKSGYVRRDLAAMFGAQHIASL